MQRQTNNFGESYYTEYNFRFLQFYFDRTRFLRYNNTEVVFNLSEEDGKTKIDFIHIGLVPGVECYEVCEKGWDGHINTLEKFVNEGKAIPQ